MEKKLKVLVFADFVYPHKNGVWEYIFNIYRNLIEEEKVELTILTFNNTNSKTEEIYNNIKIIRVPSYSLLSGTYNLPKYFQWRKISKKLQKEDFDIVNTHTRFFLSSLLGHFFAKKNNIKHIHTEHGAMFVPHPNFMVRIISRIYDETLGRLVISKASIVCPISKKGENFCKRLGAKKTEIIYNGISKDFNKISTPELNKVNLKDKLNIVFVGRIVEAKGLNELLLSCSKLQFDYNLFIIGDGNYLKDTKSLSKKLNILNQIHFLGFKDRDYIMSFLPKMDVFVNPSYAEGFPTSVLEAGISGINVIATDVGGTKEILKDLPDTYLIRPKNTNDIVLALNKVNKNKNKSEDLKLHILANFEWNKISKKFYDRVFLR